MTTTTDGRPFAAALRLLALYAAVEIDPRRQAHVERLEAIARQYGATDHDIARAQGRAS